MKLRKPKPTTVKLKDDKGKLTGETKTRATSYHEISIPDQYIKKAGWTAGEELAVQVTRHSGDNILIIRNVDKQSMTMDYFTGA